MEKDELWLGTMLDGKARWVAARTTQTVEEARQRHQTSPVATAALGRLMTGSLLLSSLYKDQENITLRLLGDGPLGGVIAVGNAQGEVRGYVHEPLVDLPLLRPGKLNVAAAVGQGELAVTRSLANGETYNGMVSIVSGEIAEDLVHYLMNSEQIPSAMLLGVLVETDYHVSASAGCLFQLMPGAEEEAIAAIENQLEKLNEGISKVAVQYNRMEEFIEALLGDLQYQILERRKVRFKCSCSRERLERTLISLGKKEIAELINDGQAETVCHFCNEKFHFNEQELKELWEQAE